MTPFHLIYAVSGRLLGRTIVVGGVLGALYGVLSIVVLTIVSGINPRIELSSLGIGIIIIGGLGSILGAVDGAFIGCIDGILTGIYTTVWHYPLKNTAIYMSTVKLIGLVLGFVITTIVYSVMLKLSEQISSTKVYLQLSDPWFLLYVILPALIAGIVTHWNNSSVAKWYATTATL